MKVLIFSDIHGNLPALEKVLRLEKSSDFIISLGDVVNYGPWSNECVKLIDSLSNVVTLMGNHDEAFVKGVYCGTNEIAVAFFNHCILGFTEQQKLEKYRLKYEHERSLFIHTLYNMYVYHDSDVNISQDTFIGHSHRMFRNKIGNHYLTNAGSLGQNRVNIDLINYVLWYPQTNKVELKELLYNSDILINEMKYKNYPEICFEYLKKKKK
uniref:metallophosphoesterase family protein n=1 Tax=Algoriphagus sp. TaxID=1872435 RepID=UPI004048068B